MSHSLIGKYVYLYYLRHRDILSDRKLTKWGLEQDAIFSRNANLDAFWSVVEKLDGWLNGSAFVLERRSLGVDVEPTPKSCGTSRGRLRDRQLVLDFGVYDFPSFPSRPSVIYEQFLHAPNTHGTPTGRRAAASHTYPARQFHA